MLAMEGCFGARRHVNSRSLGSDGGVNLKMPPVSSCYQARFQKMLVGIHLSSGYGSVQHGRKSRTDINL
jgi:hypothetical protein